MGELFVHKPERCSHPSVRFPNIKQRISDCNNCNYNIKNQKQPSIAEVKGTFSTELDHIISRTERVSVIIVAKNAANTIRQTIGSLMMQSVKPYEVILVVDSPNDPTLGAVEGYSIRKVINEEPGIGAARKKGVEESKGDIVAFLDSDCVADKNWIDNLIKSFRKFPEVKAQAGAIIEVKDLGNIDHAYTCVRELFEITEEYRFVKFWPTMNFAFWKEITKVIGNFSPDFRSRGEDQDFCNRLTLAGLSILYNPKARICHIHHRASTHLRKAINGGKERAKLFLKYRSAKVPDYIPFVHLFLLISSAITALLGHGLASLLFLSISLAHRITRVTREMREKTLMATRARYIKLYDALVAHTVLAYLNYFVFMGYLIYHAFVGKGGKHTTW